MIKTLYLRTVLTFIGVVILSIIASYFISLSLFETEMTELLQEEMAVVGKQVISFYETQAPPDKDVYFRNIAKFNSYWFLLYDDSGGRQAFAPHDTKERREISPDVVRSVVQGGVYRSPLDEDVEYMQTTIGLPLQIDSKRYALFIQPAPENQQHEKKAIFYLVTVLSIVLGVGSLLILIFSRYLVKPLVQMTSATKRLAKGDFDARIRFTRKDELGTLADSFNHMAQKLQEIEQMRQDFVSNVSHEIQSPLTSIKGFSKALHEGELPDDTRKRYLQIIHEESERLSRLSENLLRLASLEAKHHPFRPLPYALDEGLRHAVIAAEPLWSAKGLTVELDLRPIILIADSDQLSQVWTNLLGNAIKYTPPGGTISLSLAEAENSVTVSIRDTGIGIPAEDLDKIYERFYKVDKARDRSVGGNGLGLAIVKTIISIHGGEIALESAVGQGSTFSVTLPKP